MSATENIQEVVTTASSVDLSIVSLIASSDLVSKSVILILILCSIWSWALIINKYTKFKSVKNRISRFEKTFWSGQVLDQLFAKVKQNIDNPL